MGMDVYGLDPQNEKGEYFRANVWYWHPLWGYFEDLHPNIAKKVPHAHENSGDGLNARDALALSKILKKDIEKGITQKYIEEYKAYADSLPLEDCKYCDENGNRTWPTEEGQEELVACNVCQGKKKVKSFVTWYNMDLELMKEFQQFLENCGGFQIC